MSDLSILSGFTVGSRIELDFEDALILNPLAQFVHPNCQGKCWKTEKRNAPIMRTPFLLIAAFIAGQADADLIPLSAFRSLGISGNIGGSSYSQSISSDLFATFDRSLSDALTIPALMSSTFGGGIGLLHVDSLASQTSTITADAIALSASLRVNLGPFLDPAFPPSPRQSQASFGFEYTFNVLQPLTYELTAPIERSSGHGALPPNIDIFLSSAGVFTIPLYSGGIVSRSGVLLPDTYTLRVASNTLVYSDPLGDFQNVNLSLNFRTSPVPDLGSTAVLLAIGFAGLIVVLRITNRNTGLGAPSI